MSMIGSDRWCRVGVFVLCWLLVVCYRVGIGLVYWLVVLGWLDGSWW